MADTQQLTNLYNGYFTFSDLSNQPNITKFLPVEAKSGAAFMLVNDSFVLLGFSNHLYISPRSNISSDTWNKLISNNDIDFTPYLKSVDAQNIYEAKSDFNQTLATLVTQDSLNNQLVSYVKQADLDRQLTGYDKSAEVNAKDATTLTDAKAYADSQINSQIKALVDGAPKALDTLKEIADKLSGDDTSINVLLKNIASKADAGNVYTKNEIDTKINSLVNSTSMQAVLKPLQDQSYKWSDDVTKIDSVFATVPSIGLVNGNYRLFTLANISGNPSMVVREWQPFGMGCLFKSVNGNDWLMIGQMNLG